VGKHNGTETEQIERLRREGEVGGGALVDMRIAVVFEDEIVLDVGGLWDRRLGDYDGDAESCVVVRPHVGQIHTVLWFARWLAVHAGRRDDPPSMEDYDENAVTPDDEAFSAMFAGGRRGGKTWIAAVCCAIYAVMFPDAIIWVVNPNDNSHDEVKRYMSELLAPEWIARETAADGWELINGSAIMLKSAYVGADPDAIKKGEAHLVWMNEGQKMAERVYVVGRGAVADHSGLVLICANPPVEAKDQQWVGDFAADATAKRRQAAYHHFNPLDNPHINRAALMSMKREVDERTYRIEILGEFLGPADAVAWNWIRTDDGNERPMPRPTWSRGMQLPCPVTGLLDVTSEFLELEEEGSGITDLIGLDVQVHPHIGGPIYRLYAPADVRPNRDNVLAWIVGEVVLEGGDEADWCDELERRKFDPDSTLIVCDASGRYQHSRRRNADSPPPTWTGKGSFEIIKNAGYRNIVPPSRRMKKNPDVIDRVRAFTSMISTASGKRRLFADRDQAPMCCKSIRDWPTVHGKPSRSHEAAHLGDASSYPIVRLFPRILRSDKPGADDPIVQRVDRMDHRPKFLGPPPAAGRPRRGGRPERGL